MKSRQGFVSNSSSSSFVVLFDSIPKTAEELQKLMFGDKEILKVYDHKVSTKEAAEDVFADMQKKGPISLGSALMMLECGVVDNGEFGFHQDYEAHWKKCREKAEAEMKAKAPGKKIYAFSYSDNEGDFGAAMEHGGIFENFTHVRISHH